MLLPALFPFERAGGRPFRPQVVAAHRPLATAALLHAPDAARYAVPSVAARRAMRTAPPRTQVDGERRRPAAGRADRPPVRMGKALGSSTDAPRLNRSRPPARAGRWAFCSSRCWRPSGPRCGAPSSTRRPTRCRVNSSPAPSPDLILVRHTAISALGMSSMEQMAVSVSPAQVDPLGLQAWRSGASGRPTARGAASCCCGSSGGASGGRSLPAGSARVGHQELDVGVVDVIAECRNLRPADRGAALLDDVEEIAVGLTTASLSQIARLQQEERRPPGPAPVHAVTLDAVRVEQPLAARGAGRRPRVRQEPRRTTRKRPDAADRNHQRNDRTPHASRE